MLSAYDPGLLGLARKVKCEVDPEHIECAWQLIYDRMEKLGRLEELEEPKPMKDWSTHRDGGPRTIKREDAVLSSGNETGKH